MKRIDTRDEEKLSASKFRQIHGACRKHIVLLTYCVTLDMLDAVIACDPAAWVHPVVVINLVRGSRDRLVIL